MKSNVQFGGPYLAILGVIAGVVIAVCLPLIVLVYGQSLGTTVLTLLIILALIAGGIIAFISAFFGTVMPRVVEHNQGGKEKVIIGGGGVKIVKGENEEEDQGDNPPKAPQAVSQKEGEKE